MSLSRRSFVKLSGLAAGTALTHSWVTDSWVNARGLEAWRLGLEEPPMPGAPDIILSSNENPLGPGAKVLGAIRDALGPQGAPAGRYPGAFENPMAEAIAKKFGVKPANVMVGCGSTQVLVTVTQVYTSREKPLIGTLPTYEECTDYAQLIGSPIKAVPLDSRLKMDLDRTLHASKGGGLLFLCNPNNPVATMVSSKDTKDFIARLLKRSPGTRILVDEAYIDYVTDPAHETLIPLALEEPRVIIARTFSKAYGMAGLRLGYAIAHADTIKELSAWHMGNSISALSLAAGIAAIEQDAGFIEAERERNRKARDYTTGFFTKAGRFVTESQTNFLFVDVGMPIEEFQAACRDKGIRVGRPFPPLWTHARISLGTLEEMQVATKVFGEVLAAAKAA